MHADSQPLLPARMKKAASDGAAQASQVSHSDDNFFCCGALQFLWRKSAKISPSIMLYQKATISAEFLALSLCLRAHCEVVWEEYDSTTGPGYPAMTKRKKRTRCGEGS